MYSVIVKILQKKNIYKIKFTSLKYVLEDIIAEILCLFNCKKNEDKKVTNQNIFDHKIIIFTKSGPVLFWRGNKDLDIQKNKIDFLIVKEITKKKNKFKLIY